MAYRIKAKWNYLDHAIRPGFFAYRLHILCIMFARLCEEPAYILLRISRKLYPLANLTDPFPDN